MSNFNIEIQEKVGEEDKQLNESKNAAQGLEENWTEIAEDERTSDDQMEAVAGNLSSRLYHVEKKTQLRWKTFGLLDRKNNREAKKVKKCKSSGIP